jgi:hypothetical protein
MKKEAKKISQGDYLKVVGLLHLAHGYYQKTEDIIKATAGLLGEEGDNGYYGHISDLIYEDANDADSLLKALGIKVDG